MNELTKFRDQNFDQVNIEQIIVIILFDDFDVGKLWVVSLDHKGAKFEY